MDFEGEEGELPSPPPQQNRPPIRTRPPQSLAAARPVPTVSPPTGQQQQQQAWRPRPDDQAAPLRAPQNNRPPGFDGRNSGAPPVRSVASLSSAIGGRSTHGQQPPLHSSQNRGASGGMPSQGAYGVHSGAGSGPNQPRPGGGPPFPSRGLPPGRPPGARPDDLLRGGGGGQSMLADERDVRGGPGPAYRAPGSPPRGGSSSTAAQQRSTSGGPMAAATVSRGSSSSSGPLHASPPYAVSCCGDRDAVHARGSECAATT